MSPEQLELIHGFYDAMNARDLEALRAFVEAHPSDEARRAARGPGTAGGP